ncbi:MAG: stage IV sporulation protein A, partial [Lachnospiraceae bacterium]|nr:stage IV sporulation protein A [Lachnospiraceae bacterium]
MDSIYADIARRTGGDVYIGVVGPVRTGKSTLIKRIMEQLVIPGIEDPYRKERARDELPQSGSGRTIMTSEPKFIPEEAAEISPDGKTKLRVRMIDSLGYMVPGAVGAEEDGTPRMVTTPWYDYEIPMTQAAELGTKKVMEEHCSIGLVVTTDGTITDIPREDYVEAEKKAILDMQKTGKPFLIIINSRNPSGEAAQRVKESLQKEYGVAAMIADCQALDT